MPHYKLAFPPAPGSAAYQLNGINNDGSLVGVAFVDDGSTGGASGSPACWINSSAPCFYDPTLGSVGSQFVAVNDNGIATGYLDGQLASILNFHTSGIEIPNTDPAVLAFAVDINNKNVVLLEGGVTLQIQQTNAPGAAPSFSASPTPNQGAQFGSRAINNNGDVVGANTNGAFFFDGTFVYELGNDYCLCDINDNRLAVGYTTDSGSSGPTVPIYVDLSGPQAQWQVVKILRANDEFPENYPDPKFAINNSGAIVGNVKSATQNGMITYPFYFQGPLAPGQPAQQSILENLNAHISDPDITLSEVRDINDSGIIIGNSSSGWFVATPAPQVTGIGFDKGIIPVIEGVLVAVGELNGQIGRIDARLDEIMTILNDSRVMASASN